MAEVGKDEGNRQKRRKTSLPFSPPKRSRKEREK